MGLFGRKEKDVTSDSLTEAEGFCGIAACAVYSDGVLNADEDDLLMDALVSLDALQDADEEELRGALVKVSGIATRHGDAQLLRQSVEAITPARRLEALRLAAELVCADGEVDTEEREFLRRFEHALGITHEQAQAVYDGLAS